MRRVSIGMIEAVLLIKYRNTQPDSTAVLLKEYRSTLLTVLQYFLRSTGKDWAKRIDLILEAGGNDLLTNAGKVTTELAKAFAEAEFEKYRVIQDRLFQSDFDRFDSETLFPTDFNPDNT